MYETCDRCCAQAQVRVVLTNGCDLVFCNHHLREALPGLKGIVVQKSYIGRPVSV
jgi:hypothetical protein